MNLYVFPKTSVPSAYGYSNAKISNKLILAAILLTLSQAQAGELSIANWSYSRPRREG